MRVAVPSATRKLGPHMIFMTNPEATVRQCQLEGSWDTNSATSASFDRHALQEKCLAPACLLEAQVEV